MHNKFKNVSDESPISFDWCQKQFLLKREHQHFIWPINDCHPFSLSSPYTCSHGAQILHRPDFYISWAPLKIWVQSLNHQQMIISSLLMIIIILTMSEWFYWTQIFLGSSGNIKVGPVQNFGFIAASIWALEAKRMTHICWPDEVLMVPSDLSSKEPQLDWRPCIKIKM